MTGVDPCYILPDGFRGAVVDETTSDGEFTPQLLSRIVRMPKPVWDLAEKHLGQNGTEADAAAIVPLLSSPKTNVRHGAHVFARAIGTASLKPLEAFVEAADDPDALGVSTAQHLLANLRTLALQ